MIDPYTCRHSSTEARRRTKSNGVIVVAVQCTECGRHMGEKSKAEFNVDVLPLYDENLLSQSYQLSAPMRLAEREAASAEWWTRYNTYLDSEHWQKVRRIVLARDPLCQVCFRARSEQAHHLSYESFKRWGVSFAIECVGVCKPCHDNLHHGLI